mgnify:FL=1
MRIKPKSSFLDCKGKLYIDCAECEIGGNGNDPNKCSNGWNQKKIRRGGCYNGILMSEFENPLQLKTS